MLYSSRLGCITFYNKSSSSHCLCEMPVLFLLGLYAILNEDNDISDSISFTREQVPYIFDSIAKYLYPNKDYSSESIVTYDCSSIMPFMNVLTGTGINRMVPIIYHDSTGIDDPSNFNDNAEKLYSIFKDAGYCKKTNTLKLKGKFGITDESELALIEEYNTSLLEEHNRRKSNSDTYKYIDYKAMYTYALGVLYGCTCLGYSQNSIWNIDPSTYYTGRLINLVSTAFATFRFRFTKTCKIDCDASLRQKYKGVSENCIWNFTDDSLIVEPDDYDLLTKYYNLLTLVSVYVSKDDPALVWVGGSTLVHYTELGYSLTPSESIESYIDNGEFPEYFDLRYNSNLGYWSSKFDPKEWKDSFTEALYKKGDSISLFNESAPVASNLKSYYLISDDSTLYIYNDGTSTLLSVYPRGFVDVDDLLSSGITPYKRELILEDVNGESLLDENGNPLVWKNLDTGKYWNGILQMWQDTEPVRDSKFVYDSSADTKIAISDQYDEFIVMNGEVIPYNEFYSSDNNTLGVVRDITKICSKDEVTPSNILDCYYDSYSDKYCIPGVTSTWVSKQDIMNLNYKYVNGIVTYYIGSRQISLVYDNDMAD